MKFNKIYQLNQSKINIHVNNKLLTEFHCRTTNIKFYQFDFPQSKRTILAGYKDEIEYKYEIIPPFSILLSNLSLNAMTCVLMGEIKNNKLYGLKINGYKPWICGDMFYKAYPNPENDINYVINNLWLTNFPYYYNNTYHKTYINLKLTLKEIK